MIEPRPGSASEGEAAALAAKVIELEAQLAEAQETLDAIRNGDVDAVVIGSPEGQRVYTLENADRPYRVLIEQMQEGAVTLSAEGTILYCNQRFATILGLPRETLIGEDFARFVIIEDLEFFQGLLVQGANAGVAGELTLGDSGGAPVPVNLSLVNLIVEDGLPRVVCGVVTDLTQNRRRSRELAAANHQLAREIDERRRAEDRLGLALDAAEMGSWDLDLASQTAVRSLRHDQIYGYHELRASWNLSDSLEQMLPEDRERVSQAFRQAIVTGSVEFETKVRRVDNGEKRWISVKGQTSYSGGSAVRIAGVISDVTARREVEEQLRQAQKMEAVGQLTGGIAHDFNNLLMVIGGSLEMLSRRVPADQRITRLLDAAQQGVQRGAKLNQQLLSFSRRQDMRAEVICIDELIPNFEHLLDRALGETIKVRFEPAPQVWYCRTDPNQLETAVLNLAINARDAMPEGGTLTLSTSIRTLKPSAAASMGADAGEYVVVSVADSGTGMSPHVLGRVFEPFFTTKEVGKGTGLGLSQVYGFAKQSGGFVSIESDLGQGTTVLIHLPRVLERDAVIADKAGSIVESGGRGIVLVVEDDADVRAVTCSMLNELGYGVREAASAPAALRLLSADSSGIDLVMTDVIMPEGMSGIDLAREVRSRWPKKPVLLTSGFTAQGIKLEVDAERVLRKPFSLPDLGQSVLAALNLKLERNR